MISGTSIGSCFRPYVTGYLPPPQKKHLPPEITIACTDALVRLGFKSYGVMVWGVGWG